ncbi:MAG: cytochrome c3 family protein [Anaerolineales bacterium]
MKITNVMKRILGILTRKEALAALLPSAAILGASIISGGAMFSPGDLNDSESNLPKGGVRSHADLERECAACHVPFWSEEHMQDRCIACHTEVAEEREIESSMHGFFDTLYTCQECHIEHHGATAPLTDFKRRTRMWGSSSPRIGSCRPQANLSVNRAIHKACMSSTLIPVENATNKMMPAAHRNTSISSTGIV